MIDEIFYIVGAYGSGKTTLIESYQKKEGFETLLEDESILFFIKNKDIPIRCLTATTICWYRLIDKIKSISKKPEVATLLVDSHPCVSHMYGQAVFEIELGKTYSLLDIKEYGRLHYSLAKHTKEIMDIFNQTFIYINLPLGVNWQMIQGRYKERKEDFEEENDFDYLVAVRRAFSQNIRHLAEELYGAEFVEVNSLEDAHKCIG